MKEQNLKIMNKALALLKAEGFSPESVFCEGEELYTPDAESVINEIATMTDASVTLFKATPESRQLVCVSVFDDDLPTVVAINGAPKAMGQEIQQVLRAGGA